MVKIKMYEERASDVMEKFFKKNKNKWLKKSDLKKLGLSDSNIRTGAKNLIWRDIIISRFNGRANEYLYLNRK